MLKKSHFQRVLKGITKEEFISQFTSDMAAEEMVDGILNDAISFGGDKISRDDDMTVVVAEVL